jgi:tetratricopeptide (TPR) repeat protein
LTTKELLTLAQTLSNHKKSDELAKLLTDETLEKHQNFQLYYNAANLHSNSHPLIAIDYYTKALALNPNFGPAYANRGTQYVLMGEKKLAMDDLNKAVEINNDALSHFLRGQAFLQLNELDNAAADYEKAVKMSPNNLYFLYQRAYVAALQNDFDKSLNLLNTAISIKGDFTIALLLRGDVYANQKEYEKALTDFNSVLTLDANFMEAYISRGRVWLSIGRYWNAIDDFTSSLNLAPDNLEILELRGLANYYAREYSPALNDFERILSLKGNLSEESRQAREISAINIQSLIDLTSLKEKEPETKRKKAAKHPAEERPPIPGAIKQAVRQKCKSRCVICGSAVYDFDHIEEWSVVQEHTADNLTLLCPNHHRQKTNGILSKNVIRERTVSQMIQPTTGADLNFKTCKLVLGTNIIQTLPGILFKVFDRDFFRLSYDPVYKQAIINAAFFNSAGEVAFKIVDNVYSTSDDVWDVEIVGKTITIREGKGNILLEITFDGVRNQISVLGKIYFDASRYIQIKEDGIYCNGNLKVQLCTIVSCQVGLWIDNNDNIPPGAGIRCLGRGPIIRAKIKQGVTGIALPIEGLEQEYL